MAGSDGSAGGSVGGGYGGMPQQQNGSYGDQYQYGHQQQQSQQWGLSPMDGKARGGFGGQLQQQQQAPVEMSANGPMVSEMPAGGREMAAELPGEERRR